MDFPAIEIYNPEALSSDFLSSFIQRHTQTHKVYRVKKQNWRKNYCLFFFEIVTLTNRVVVIGLRYRFWRFGKTYG